MDVQLKRFGINLKQNNYTVIPLEDSKDKVETVFIHKQELLDICNHLKNSESCLFDILVSISAVDTHKDNKFNLVYHLLS